MCIMQMHRVENSQYIDTGNIGKQLALVNLIFTLNARKTIHRLVVNIPGTKVEEGETLSEYIGSGPGQDTGLHRYVFLVYKQNAKIDFDEKRSSKSCSREERRSFKVHEFAEKYQLGNPVAANFYLAEWHNA